MRTVVDKNEAKQVVKISHGGKLHGYNVEDLGKEPGSFGYAVSFHSNLKDAREYAGIVLNTAPKLTKPKSEYPEQQTGYKRPARKR